MVVEIFATTDTGSRSYNEDNFAVCKDLSQKSWSFMPHEKFSLSESGAVLLVADGMGGTNAGEVASDIAQQHIQDQFNTLTDIPTTDKARLSLLQSMVMEAHRALVAHQETNLETAGMGTTLIILWVFTDKAFVAWCGDSRLYVYRKHEALAPFTDDHSLVWQLVKQGQLTPEEARLHPESNIITQSLGDPSYPPKPDASLIDIKTGDRFLLCSDGLNGMLSDDEIYTILTQEEDTVQASKRLVYEANQAGGKDNITVVMLDVVQKDEVAEAPSEPDTTNPLSVVPPKPHTTQELKNYISTRNKVIGALTGLLCLALTYIVIDKHLFTAEEPEAGTQPHSEAPASANFPLITPEDEPAGPAIADQEHVIAVPVSNTKPEPIKKPTPAFSNNQVPDTASSKEVKTKADSLPVKTKQDTSANPSAPATAPLQNGTTVNVNPKTDKEAEAQRQLQESTKKAEAKPEKTSATTTDSTDKF